MNTMGTQEKIHVGEHISGNASFETGEEYGIQIFDTNTRTTTNSIKSEVLRSW